jgi:surfeit locus 1 family protein
VLCLVGVAILIGLGVWQLQRLKWKEDLLARVAALKTAPARPLDQVLKAGGDLDFVRVSFTCPDIAKRPTLRFFSVIEGHVGYRLIAACPIAENGASSILVDRGFEHYESENLTQPSTPDCTRTPLPPLTEPLVGILRKPDKPTFVTPVNRVTDNLWYSRDLPAMARALKAGQSPPAFVALEPVSLATRASLEPCAPIPVALPTDIPNRHLEYALTWFGLAAALVGVYLAMLLRRR